MRTRFRFGMAAPACLMVCSLTLVGCGGGGSSQSSQTSDPLATGRAALIRLAGSQSAADTTTLQSILKQFELALKLRPDSADARFGIALCLAGVAGNQLDGGPASGETAQPGGGSSSGSGGQLPNAPTTGEVPPAPPGHGMPIQPLPPAHRLSLLWNIDSALSNPYALLNMLAPIGSLQYGLIPFYGYAQDSSDVARRQTLLANLDTVAANLVAIEAHPDFTTTLPDPTRGGQLVTVGLPEVYLFDAYVNSLRAEVALSLAYIRDPGGIQLIPTPVPVTGGGSGFEPAIFAVGTGGPGNTGSGTPSTIYVALDANHDGKLSPSEYLPPSPYLTLRSPDLLTKAQQAMQAIVDRENKGIAGVFARPADGVFLVSDTAQVRATLTEVRDHVLPLIGQAATGPITLDLPHFHPLSDAIHSADPPPPPPGSNAGGVFSFYPPGAPGGSEPPLPPIFDTEKVTVDIAAWFKQPPRDLKVFAPIYRLNAAGIPDPKLTKYPDSTFGGLFPSGLPRDLLF